MSAREQSALTRPKRLGDRLLEAGLITRTQLDTALNHQESRIDGGRRLGRTLVDLGYLTERDLIQMLSVYFGIPVAPFAVADAEARAIMSLPARIARRYRALPCRLLAGSLLVAVADAIPPDAVEELEAASGHPVLLYLGSELEIDAAMPKYYGRPTILPARLRDLAGNLLRLADAHERLALVLDASEHTRKTPEEEARLRAEIEQLQGNIETLLSALTDVSNELRDRYGARPRHASAPGALPPARSRGAHGGPGPPGPPM